MRELKPRTILDAGSGFGQYSYYVAKNSDAEVLGVDINGDEVEKCNKFAGAMRIARLSFQQGDLEKLEIDRKFDLVISVDVMEHIKNDLQVFTNFFRLLSAGGKVLISTPSNFGGSNVHEEGEHSFIDEHYRDGYTESDITSKLESAGFKIESIRYTYGKIGSWYWNLAVRIPVRLLNRSFGFMLVLPFYYILVFPFALVFMTFDYYFPPEKGSGLLVIARKGG